jgi:hypothetical protein
MTKLHIKHARIVYYIHYYYYSNITIYIELPSIAVTLCTRIRERLGSIFGRNNSGSPDVGFLWLSPVLPVKCRDSISIGLRSLRRNPFQFVNYRAIQRYVVHITGSVIKQSTKLI